MDKWLLPVAIVLAVSTASSPKTLVETLVDTLRATLEQVLLFSGLFSGKSYLRASLSLARRSSARSFRAHSRLFRRSDACLCITQ